jgi:tetratricopeptide (TPR) repeat protein
MKQIQTSILIFTIFVIIFVGYLFPTIAAAEMDDYWVGKIVSVQGSVQVRRAGAAEWVTVRLNDTYGFGDIIRVQEQSRAAVVLRNEAIIRLDQMTTITFSVSEPEEKTSLLNLLHGAAHFFSPTPRKLKVTTPFVNAAVDGTEFFVRVERNQTLLSVFEGRVAAINEAGSLVLASGQSAIARTGQAPVSQVVVRPRDAVQWALYYPPVLDYQLADFSGASTTNWQAMVRKSIGFFWRGDLAGAFSSLKGIPDDIRDPRFFIYRATLHLSVGRVDDASADIERALAFDPSNGHAFALQSVIAVAQNRKEQALDLAREAVYLAPESSAARVALSYAQQAHFDIKSALVSLNEAIKLDPENALVLARQAELQLSLGNQDRAVAAARQAVSLNPDIARTQTVLGFAYLTEIKTRDAKNAFKRAIELDQAAPLPRLGLGLAKIREGDLKEGRGEIEIAASLDPDNSLIRSYLGKAYFEEKREKKATSQLSMAKALDPKDPTAWFYDAILKQSQNRPVEALEDLQKSIELNDNRAVYRSRMLLDEDLAARSASLGRIYSDLGFQQLALVEGYKSLNTDPANYSAHRLLADSYAALPRHEIARVSELLQSQLLQPINVTPIQPQLAETDVLVLEGAGPGALSFNEFNPLFLRNRFVLQASGVVGSNETLGDELVHFGIHEKISYSLGQFHYETNGFRNNNDLTNDIYNVFIQGNVTHNTSVQAEIRYTEREQGDLALRTDSDFSTTLREKQRSKSYRFGFHQAFSHRSEIIGSFIYQDLDIDQRENDTVEMVAKQETERKRDGYIAELQHLFQWGKLNITSGVGHLDQDTETSIILHFYPSVIELPFPLPPLDVDIPPLTRKEDAEVRNSNIYVYTQMKLFSQFNLTAGLSVDFFEYGKQVDRDQLNPKLGMTWQPSLETTIRMALFRVLSKTFDFSQIIEPTQVAGFNQFFDDIYGSDAWRYAAAIDHKFSSHMSAGIEYSERELDVPQYGLAETKAPFRNWDERLGRAYLYWTPVPKLALSAEYQYERFDIHPLVTPTEKILKVRTHRVPLGARFFHPSGVAIGVTASYINQSGDFERQHNSEIVYSGQDAFWVLDTHINYRLPKSLGLITVGVKNLLDKSFHFHDIDSDYPIVIPERFVFARVTLAF